MTQLESDTYWVNIDNKDVVYITDIDENMVYAKCVYKKHSWYHYLIGDFLKEFTQIEKPKEN